MNLLAIVWDIEPELIKIGSLAVRYYSLLFAGAFFLSYYFFKKFYAHAGKPIEELDKLTMYIAIGTILGARLGHCLFYDWAYFSSRPEEILLPFKIRDGFEFTGFQGLASHGAGIGILTAAFLYARKFKYNLMWVFDKLAIVVPIAGASIRLGNLFNSEIYGVETSLPWGFVFNGETVPKHPTQLYEALAYICIFIFLYKLYNQKKNDTTPGILTGLMFILLFAARFLIEFVKNDQKDFEASMAINMGQSLSIPFIIAGIVIFVVSKRKMIKW